MTDTQYTRVCIYIRLFLFVRLLLFSERSKRCVCMCVYSYSIRSVSQKYEEQAIYLMAINEMIIPVLGYRYITKTSFLYVYIRN